MVRVPWRMTKARLVRIRILTGHSRHRAQRRRSGPASGKSAGSILEKSAVAVARPMRLKKTGESWMKAYRIHSGRKQDALELIGHVVSNPTARGVRVRVRAVSLNYRDLLIAWGRYPIPSDPPPIAVADGAGEVIAVGPQVTRFKVGDHVAILHYPDWIDGEPTAESVH